MSTEKLYYTDPYKKEFTAIVTAAVPLADGGWGVVLDRTAFYPEGGGQPYDTGWLDDIPVTAVYEKNGEVIHTVTAKPASGQVNGRVDWGRRFDHMQQHSGEHLLSGVFLSMYGAENIGFHLGTDGVYIDITLDALTAEQATAVEEAANAHVFANLPVSCRIIDEADLDKYPLRKRPTKSFARIRLVAVDGVDCCLCGGTHVRATGEIGLIKIRSWERRGGAIRVDFVCGARALADYRLNNNVVRELTAQLSVPAAELPAALARSLARTESLHKDLQAAKQELNKHLAAALYAEGETAGDARLIVRKADGVAPAELADLARQVLAAGRAVVLLATANAEQNKSQLLFACTPGLAADMGGLLKKALTFAGGKGGGNANWAQGGGPYSDKLEDALQLARQDVLNGK